MKRLVLFLFTLLSFSVAFAQPGSLIQSVYRSRVNDSTAAISANVTPISQGYAPLFWNNQATTPHWDWWDGSAYVHGFGTGTGGGAGTVTSVGWTGGIVSIANATTTPAFTIAGTSGGIPYFNSSSTWATSGALAANALVIGGGAGSAPSTTTTGTGVLTALAINVGSNGAFSTGAYTSSSLTDGGTITITGPKHTLTSDEATITWTLSQLEDNSVTTTILNTATATWTFPANTLCKVNGVASGDNTAVLVGNVGDEWMMAIHKDGTTYKVAISNWEQ